MKKAKQIVRKKSPLIGLLAQHQNQEHYKGKPILKTLAISQLYTELIYNYTTIQKLLLRTFTKNCGTESIDRSANNS